MSVPPDNMMQQFAGGASGAAAGAPDMGPQGMPGQQSPASMIPQLLQQSSDAQGQEQQVIQQEAASTQQTMQKLEGMQPPKRDLKVMETAPFLVALAAIGGKAFGLHSQTMLAATNGMVKGLLMGSDKQYEDAFNQYHDAQKKIVDLWEMQQKVYDTMSRSYQHMADGKYRAAALAETMTNDSFQQKMAEKGMQFKQDQLGEDKKMDDFNRWAQKQKIMQGWQKLKEERKGIKPPSGFEWDPDKPDQLRPIAGGPKDPNAATQQGSRESTMQQRMITSAREALGDVQNIAKLPISASTGIFGGTTHKGNIMDAPKSALSNEMSSQETQLYNTMIAGVQRNLASIESVGLMPSGTLTAQMDAVTIQPGQTYTTKLAKMAQIRQIAENGLEPVMNNPRVPQQTKEYVKQIVDEYKKTIPWTNSDVISLYESDNPKATIMDFAGKKGLAEKEGEKMTSKSGRPMHKVGDHWEYDD